MEEIKELKRQSLLLLTKIENVIDKELKAKDLKLEGLKDFLKTEHREMEEKEENMNIQLQLFQVELSGIKETHNEQLKNKKHEIQTLTQQVKDLKVKIDQILEENENLMKKHEEILTNNKYLEGENDRLKETLKNINNNQLKLENEVACLSERNLEYQHSRSIITGLRSENQELKEQLQLRDMEIAKTEEKVKMVSARREKLAKSMSPNNPFLKEINNFSTEKPPNDFWRQEMNEMIARLERELLKKEEIIDRMTRMCRFPQAKA